MHRLFKMTAPLAVLALLLTAVAIGQASDQAAPRNSDVSLDEVDLGTHVYGPKVDADALAGKVVVVEYWGDRCGPCIQAIPHLVKLRKAYSTDQLQIVANQVWTKDLEQAKQVWIKAGGSDAITVINHGVIKGATVRGVPHAFVFDHDGQMVWRGHPAQPAFDQAIKEAVENTSF